MATLAIRGHENRGKEVIEILEMLGGINGHIYRGNKKFKYYFIKNNHIDWCYECTPKSNFISFTLEDFLEKFPYKVWGRVIHNKDIELEVVKMYWDDKFNIVRYDVQGVVDKTFTLEGLMAAHLQPYKEETMKGTMVEKDEKSVNHVFDTEIISFDIAQRDKYELDLQGKFEVVLREGVYYVERIKPQYPKTYEECCKIVNASPYVKLVYNISDGHKYSYDEDNLQLYENIRRLKICRDAYWKIYGEEIGLRKPWTPELHEGFCYTARVINDELLQDAVHFPIVDFLSFPTEEVLRKFVEEFADIIIQTNKLLR